MTMTLLAEPMSADLPAKVARPKVRETYFVPEADLLEFRSEVRHAGMTIVVSSPVGGGYSVTVQH